MAYVVTVTTHILLKIPEDAVMFAVPIVTPVTIPVGDTVAMPLLLLDHDNKGHAVRVP